jgi:hypothetical protein
MRVRVKVDVRQPLKKGQRVRDKEGAWCMVNFKYEKLGVFCFVCGVMGHAENKCEVRFAMENDDGRREWSGELRADQRRGGGRQTSRWLREHREGRNGATGEEERRRERSTVEIPPMGPIAADMSSTAQELPRHHNHAGVTVNGTLIPLNCHASISNAALTNSLETDGNNQAAMITASHNRHVTRQELISNETCRNQQLLEIPSPSIPVTDLPPPFWQSIPNNSHSHQLSIPNNLINTSLLPNNSPIFTTQSKITAPSKQKTRKELNLVRTQPSKKLTRPDPNMTLPYPNSNSITISSSLTRTDPLPALPNPTHDSAVDMVSHTEKKRRMEEKRQADNNDENTKQHFLSAGPGNQDCREQ